ncbi:hypothetical protein ABW20_dc0105050 [Dactylellina cionopaga]|nr:hypothetical protein ABW20_dc0105050 [Dactylellina cionopaga]
MHRARLVISRPDVPQVRILWPLDAKLSQNPRYSVYDLLTDINDIIPLDNRNLGIEDYVTELGGCELLHFMPIGQLIGDNDELTIRPLTRIEAKEHVKGGRRQVSTAGRKLQDGVPLGRNFIAPAPDRPRIEGGDRPAKRRRISRTHTDENESELDIDAWGPVAGSGAMGVLESSTPKSDSGPKTVHFEEEKNVTAESSSALVLADLSDDDDEDDEDDEDFEIDEEEDSESEDSESDDEPSIELDNLFKRIGGMSKPLQDSVRSFKSKNPMPEVKSDDSDESDDGSFKSPQVSDSSEASEESGDEDGDEDEDEENEIEDESDQTNLKQQFEKPIKSSQPTDSDSSSASDDSDDESVKSSQISDSSDSDSDSDEEASDSDSSPEESEIVPDEVSSKVEVEVVKPPPSLPSIVTVSKNQPFQGAASTKSRNQRRRESKALAKLIKTQLLPAGSTKEDLRKWKEQAVNGGDVPSVSNEGTNEKIDVLRIGAERSSVEEAPSQPALPLAQSQSPMYTPMEPLEVIVEQMEVTIEVPATAEPQPKPPVDISQVEESSSPVGVRRSRPVASDATKRLILGGLGLRKPRNQAEDEKLREDWKKANSKFVGHKTKGFLDAVAGKEGVHSRFGEDEEAPIEVQSKAVEEQDPDAWKKKIQISAVECDEYYYDGNADQLPQPSFPFDQQQLWKANGDANSSNKKGKKKKNKKNKNKQNEEPYEQESWDAGYYDDSSMHVDSAQKPGEVEHITQSGEDQDDLPQIPANLLSYPKLQMPILPESIIVFKTFGLDSNYSPSYQQYTAKVLSVDGPKIKYQLAKRDLRKRTYDKETGERIFGRFHMPGTEDEDEDAQNGIRELNFDDMIEGKVIKAGLSAAENSEVIVEEQNSERVPETVHENESLDQGNVKAEPISQTNIEDVPMLEPEDDLVPPIPEGNTPGGLSDAVHQQSSSFVEPPFQTNGSCGYGHTDTEDDQDQDLEEGQIDDQAERLDDSIPSHQPSAPHSPSAAGLGDEDTLDSSAENHRFDDLPSSFRDDVLQILSSERGSTPFHTAPEINKTPAPEEPSILVPGTPPSQPASPSLDSSRIHAWDLSVDLSTLEPAEADKVIQMVKIKEECPEDTDLLREALKPFHHPLEVTFDEVNISVDISPPMSPKIKRERLSTQEALESPVAPLQDITERSANGNNVDNIQEDRDDDDGELGGDGNSATGSGSILLGNDQSPPILGSDSSSLLKSDGMFKRRRKTGVLFRRRPSGDHQEKSKVVIKEEEVDWNDGIDDDFAIPSTMPVRSLTSGKTAFSGRNDAYQNSLATTSFAKKPELITIDSDDEFSMPPPRASLEIIGGDRAPIKPGGVKLKSQFIKKRIIPRRSESVDPDSQQRSVSSQF